MFHNKLSYFALLIAIIILFSSCDVINNCLEIYHSTKQFNSADTVSSKTLSNSSYDNSQQQNTSGKFDIEEVRKKLWLNDKQFTIPCTAEELGEEYQFDEFTLVKTFPDQPDPTYYTVVMFSNKDNSNICVFLKDVIHESDLRNKQIFGINISKGNATNFKIDKIDINSSKDDIINNFGNPTVIWGEDTDEIQIYRYIDSQNENNRLVIYYNNRTNSVNGFDLNFMEETK